MDQMGMIRKNVDPWEMKHSSHLITYRFAVPWGMRGESKIYDPAHWINSRCFLEMITTWLGGDLSISYGDLLGKWKKLKTNSYRYRRTKSLNSIRVFRHTLTPNSNIKHVTKTDLKYSDDKTWNWWLWLSPILYCKFQK